MVLSRPRLRQAGARRRRAGLRSPASTAATVNSFGLSATSAGRPSGCRPPPPTTPPAPALPHLPSSVAAVAAAGTCSSSCVGIPSPTSTVAATTRLPAATSTPRVRASPRLPASMATDAAVGTSSCIAVPSPSRSCCSSPAVLVEATVGLDSRRHGLWSSLADKDDDSEEEELAPSTPSATKRLPRDVQPAQPSVAQEADMGGGWQEVLPRRGSRQPSSPVPALPPRPIPRWLFGRCCRCLAHGHRAAVCRDPVRCSRCLENGHLMRECHNPWRPLSSLACLAAPPGSGADHRHAPASCEGLRGSALPPKALHPGSWASVVCAPTSSVAPSEVMLQSALVAQSEQLQVCLARVESFLERAEIALCKLSLVPTMLKTIPTPCPLGEVGVGSTEDMGEDLYGCFSPRVGNSSSTLSALPTVSSTAEGEANAVVVSPVLQVMPEPQEVCVSPILPLPVETMNVDSSATMSSPKRSELDSMTIPPPPTQTDNADVLFAKELCNLLSRVEVALPGCGRAIACLLTGSTIKGKNKKMSDCPRSGILKEKSLRYKGKKGGTVGKTPVAT